MKQENNARSFMRAILNQPGTFVKQEIISAERGHFCQTFLSALEDRGTVLLGRCDPARSDEADNVRAPVETVACAPGQFDPRYLPPP